MVQECLEDACETAFTDEDTYIGIFLGNSGAEGQGDSENESKIAGSLGSRIGLRGPW